MAEKRRQIPDENYDVPRKRAVNEQYLGNQERFPSRRPKPAVSENAENQRGRLSQTLKSSWKLHPIDSNERVSRNEHRSPFQRRRSLSPQMEYSDRNAHDYRFEPSSEDARRHRKPMYSHQNRYGNGSARGRFNKPQFLRRRGSYNRYDGRNDRSSFPRPESALRDGSYSHPKHRQNVAESQGMDSTGPSRERPSPRRMHVLRETRSVEGNANSLQPIVPSSRSPQHSSKRSQSRGQKRADHQTKKSSENSQNISKSSATKENTSDQPVSVPPKQGKTPSAQTSLQVANVTNQPALAPPITPGPTPAMQTSLEVENVTNQPALAPPLTPGPTPAMNQPSLSQHAAENQSKQLSKSSQNKSKDNKTDDEFIQAVRKYPRLYDPLYKDKVAKNNSWKAISDMFGMTDYECRSKWTLLRKKHTRVSKELKRSGRVTEENMQFIEKMNFLPIEEKTDSRGRNTSETSKSSASATMKQKQSESKSQRSLGSTAPLHSLSCFQSDTGTSVQRETRYSREIPMPDQSFAYDIVSALQQFTPHEKFILKAEMWRVIAEFGNSA